MTLVYGNKRPCQGMLKVLTGIVRMQKRWKKCGYGIKWYRGFRKRCIVDPITRPLYGVLGFLFKKDVEHGHFQHQMVLEGFVMARCTRVVFHLFKLKSLQFFIKNAVLRINKWLTQ
ncbi:hypothetical protein BWZ22_04005 [Seonamhaeicola sp. S2-3]|nr:hypothetical protein BWZ22_04005 [Seonamhaeicola sp. S2-3]